MNKIQSNDHDKGSYRVNKISFFPSHYQKIHT